MTKKSNSYYAIFENKNNGKKLIYYPCPKNANTSAKLFFARHLGIENKFVFLSDNIPQYKQSRSIFEKINKINIVSFLPSKQKFTKVLADEKCCIVRNPIKRFISAYNNRILFHKDTQFKNHSVDMVIEKLENNLFENKHFLPQTYFLGNDLKYFTIVANTKNISGFERKVNYFFDKKVKFPKMQTGGGEFNLKLNISQLDKLKKIYIEDFNLLETF